MAAEVDVLARALADLNVLAGSEFKLKPEQEVALKFLLDKKDVLGVLLTAVFQFFNTKLVNRDFVALSNNFQTMTSPLGYKINTVLQLNA